MSTTTDLTTLKINYLTQAQYDSAVSGGTINENEIYMTPTGSLIDLFYPVGSYYETSDTTFDPNVSWGGEWLLETEGIVHVSGKDSGTYTVSSTYTELQTPEDTVGQVQGGEATHTLTPSETATKDHSHTMSHTHSTGNSTYTHYVITTSGASIARRSIKPGTSTAVTNNLYSDAVVSHAAPAAASASNTGGQTAANGIAHNNMQPWIAVNRWHRTA